MVVLDCQKGQKPTDNQQTSGRNKTLQIVNAFPFTLYWNVTVIVWIVVLVDMSIFSEWVTSPKGDKPFGSFCIDLVDFLNGLVFIFYILLDSSCLIQMCQWAEQYQNSYIHKIHMFASLESFAPFWKHLASFASHTIHTDSQTVKSG